MLTRDAIVLDLAQNMALVPLGFLAWQARKRRADASWWWLAIAFAVSWLADAWAYLLPVSSRWVPSAVYPVLQTAIIAAVLLHRHEAIFVTVALTLLGAVAVAAQGADGPELVLRSMAWTSLAGVAIAERMLSRRLRISLAVYFGIGIVAWIARAIWPVVAVWYVYQFVRLAGLLLFCWAAARPVELCLVRGRLSRSQLRARLA